MGPGCSRSSHYLHSTRTYQFFVTLIDGKIAQRRGNRTDHPIHLHPQQLDEYRQPLLLPHRSSDLDARLPVAGGQVLERPRRSLQRLWVGAALQQRQVRLDHLRLPEQLAAFDRLRALAGASTRVAATAPAAASTAPARRVLLLNELRFLLLLASPEAAQIVACEITSPNLGYSVSLTRLNL